MDEQPLSFKNFLATDTPTEALDFSQRRARGRVMKKNKAKIAMGRRRAAKKTASVEVLKKRARKGAVNDLFKKFSKGKSRGEMPAARRAEIEKRISKMSSKVAVMTRKKLPQIRSLEKQRKMGKK